MKKWLLFFILLLIPIVKVQARSGCCSHHGGVAGCSSSGMQLCNDGTTSKSCTCTPAYVYGCTDKSAKNYNSSATRDDGSCTYYIKGCMDKEAKNYNPKADMSDDSCIYYVLGCTDTNAINYNSLAEKDDGSCEYKKDVTYVNEENKDNDDGDEDTILGLLIMGGAASGYGVYKVHKKRSF